MMIKFLLVPPRALVIWLLMLCHMVGWGVAATTGRRRRRRPHIVLIIVDDLGSHDLGRHGSGIATPTIDALADQGVFLNHYYVSPYCSPTRASLLSGRYPLHTGCHTIINDWETQGLPLDEETVAQVLHRSGYHTHAVGKWHVGHSRWEQTPTYRGFDSFYGYYLGAQDYFTHYKEGATGRGYDMHWDQQPNCGPGCSQLVDERGNYSTHVYTRRALRVIDEYVNQVNADAIDNDDRPLFLYLAYQAVHVPDQVPDTYREPYVNAHPEWTEQRQTYAGMLTCADESIANVTRALQQQGLWNDTLLIVTTDNGGPTALCGVQGSSNAPLRGGKCTIWQGGTTGDALLSGPALAKLGIQPKVYDNLFHVVDWLPTLAAMTDSVPAGKPLDGVNHWEALRHDDAPPPREELFVGYAMLPDLPHTDIWYGPAIRWKQWKLIQGKSGGPESRDGIPPGTSMPAKGGNALSPYLLFNLDEDPTEQVNVVDQHPVVFQILRKKLQEYQKTFVPPSFRNQTQWNDTTCDFHGPTQTQTYGPTWLPWCKHATEFVFYN